MSNLSISPKKFLGTAAILYCSQQQTEVVDARALRTAVSSITRALPRGANARNYGFKYVPVKDSTGDSTENLADNVVPTWNADAALEDEIAASNVINASRDKGLRKSIDYKTAIPKTEFPLTINRVVGTSCEESRLSSAISRAREGNGKRSFSSTTRENGQIKTHFRQWEIGLEDELAWEKALPTAAATEDLVVDEVGEAERRQPETNYADISREAASEDELVHSALLRKSEMSGKRRFSTSAGTSTMDLLDVLNQRAQEKKRNLEYELEYKPAQITTQDTTEPAESGDNATCRTSALNKPVAKRAMSTQAGNDYSGELAELSDSEICQIGLETELAGEFYIGKGFPKSDFLANHYNGIVCKYSATNAPYLRTLFQGIGARHFSNYCSIQDSDISKIEEGEKRVIEIIDSEHAWNQIFEVIRTYFTDFVNEVNFFEEDDLITKSEECADALNNVNYIEKKHFLTFQNSLNEITKELNEIAFTDPFMKPELLRVALAEKSKAEDETTKADSTVKDAYVAGLLQKAYVEIEKSLSELRRIN